MLLPPPSVAAAPTFVCLHYWAGSGREWAAVAAELAPEYTCLTPDLGGFGEAPAPASGYSVAAYAESVANYIAEQKLSNYILVGHSMGGKIALALAARQPAGLLGIVLLSPSPPSPEPMTDEERTASLHAYGNPEAAARTLARITARPLSETMQAQVIEDNLRTTRAAWEAWLLHGSRENILALMPLLHVPAVVLAGDADAVMSPSLHGLETLPHLPPDTPLEIIGGAGHLLPLEAPREVAALLREFVAIGARGTRPSLFD
ncbi:alpha/beta hydrolase fold [Hymenobacter roseosalivarius DSM 11622]|uniref:Alpha/beta hydrolase fold n=1 Tax=Hymenobacter roseosalivarius DSM 11622 TaxID=645990 RepID=A0A1W1UVH7_9BACT|nr:alpha/beta hydrolase [Hymenobacter roseosalivarius]SMB85036.1 alpha/beta hydrolase fold [Hymenobacter roseosalivarius DSM 11622]